MDSHALSAQQPNKNKVLAQENEPSKGKQLAMSPSSNSSKDSSYSLTSDSIPLKLEPKNITFGDMHLEASANGGNMSIKEKLHTHRVTSSQSNGQRRTTSHKKYEF